jgi:type I restriction enzyme S subunit
MCNFFSKGTEHRMLDSQDMPDGWRREPLAKCVEVLDSLRKPVNSKERALRMGAIPYYGATGQVGWIDDYLFDEEIVLLGEDGAPFHDKSKPIAYIVDGKSWVNNHAHVLRARPAITSNRFMKYYLDTFDFNGYVQGSTRDKLTQGAMNSIPVLLPPRDIQDELVNLIETVESKRASSGSHLAVARRAIERFRQAVLIAGCSGRLTAEWRSSMGREPDSDQPAGWSEATVASLAADAPRAIQSGPFGSNLKHSEFQTTGRLVIGIDNVLDGQFVLGSQHRISEAKFAELKKYEARPLDVLITVVATVGRVCVMPSDIESSIITKHVYRITVDQERVLPSFLMQALRGHPKVREQIHSQTRGQTRPGINGQIVKGIVIALPPIDEQREVVRRLEQLLALAEGLQLRIAAASRRVERSSQAVLVKAFRGELSRNGALRELGRAAVSRGSDA